MIAADIDASLRTADRLLESLDDGFSPPQDDATESLAGAEAAEAALGEKSPF